MSLDWVVIGGGVHGVHLAIRLISEARVKPENLRIVDPAKNLLDRWNSCTKITGMTHLRSPSVHNLATEPMSLSVLADSLDVQKSVLFAPPYDRPHLNFFNEHCSRLIQRYSLDDLHIQAKAIECKVDCDGAYVMTCTGEKMSTKNVILAIGAGDRPMWPKWAKNFDKLVHHIFDSEFDGWPKGRETVAVVGGGISAGQVALRLQDEGNIVHLISRHEMREHQFDSDPGWLGPKYMTGFLKEKDVNKRRKIIGKARHRGSVPPDVHNSILQAIDNEEFSLHREGISDLRIVNEMCEIEFIGGGKIKVDRVLLATGFEKDRPGGDLIDNLIKSASLPCAECGYPIVDEDLCWHPRIYVSGPLAELEIGPSSRNISGARSAAKRIIKAARRNMLTH